MAPGPDAITDGHRRRALALLFLVSLFNYGDRNMIGVLVPAIKADLSLSDTQIGFITGLAFSLFYALMAVPIARLADVLSRKAVLSLALGIWSAMTVACGLAVSFFQLAVARVLVGVGEAGATPPSHAIIADLFPKDRRARALSVYSLGSPAGVIVAYLAGAWLTEEYGWRTTLFVFGLPGLVAALGIYLLLVEPPRGHSENADPDAAPAGLKEALATLLSKPAFVHNALGSGAYALLWIGLLAWTPSFFTRSHAMPLKDAGAWLALALGVSQLIALWTGGVWGDRLAARDVRWYPWLSTIVLLASMPFYFAVFLAADPRVAMAALFFAVLLSLMQTGPQHWVTQAVAGPRMRATASALYFLIVNLIAGWGPQIIGLLSDTLAPTYGGASLGLAMLGIALVFSAWAAAHSWLTSRALVRDIAV